MKNIKRMDYLLVIGSIILFLAGIALTFNEHFSYFLYKIICIFTIGVVLYLLAYVFKVILNVDRSSKVSAILGSIAIITSYVIAGYNELFGIYFSLSGDGVHIFLASIALLMILFAIINKTAYKWYSMIAVIYMSILYFVFELLLYFNLSIEIDLIICGIILLGTSIIKTDSLEKYLDLPVYLYTIIALINGFKGNYLLVSIMLSLNLICLVINLAKRKNILCQIITLLLTCSLLITYLTEAYETINIGMTTVTTILIISIYELSNNVFKIYKSPIIYSILKIVFFIIIISLINGAEVYLLAKVISLVFILITSVVNSYIIKNDLIEKFILPVKLTYIISQIFFIIESQFIDLNDVYLYAIIALACSYAYTLLKNNKEKISYLVINILSVLCMTGIKDLTTLEIVAYILILFINYILLYKNDDNENKVVSRIFLSIISIIYCALLNETLINNNLITYMMVMVVTTIIAYLNKNDKYSFVVAALTLYMGIHSFIYSIFEAGDIPLIISITLLLIEIVITGEILFKEIKDKMVFEGIIISFILIYLLSASESFIIIIYSLIVSLIIILVTLKNDNYKPLYYIGVISVLLNLISILKHLGGLPVAIYLLLIAIVLITIVSAMLYQSQNKKDKNIDIYCNNCGKKINTSYNFCDNCGNKLK